jgi:hypothetical protein
MDAEKINLLLLHAEQHLRGRFYRAACSVFSKRSYQRELSDRSFAYATTPKGLTLTLTQHALLGLPPCSENDLFWNRRHRTSWKRFSANFASEEFSEVQGDLSGA